MKLVFATNNQNKIFEIQKILPPSFDILSLKDINCLEELPETQDTIEGNALQKSSYVLNHYHYDCFADDTGLEIEALEGEPGVYSARYAGPQRNTVDNIEKVLHKLKDHHHRNAQFKTVISLQLKGKVYSFEGICKGRITENIQGTGGFGYDPIFKPDGYDLTFAEMPLPHKNKISHRGRAVTKLMSFLKDF